jgi:hypothetical protein
LPQIAAAVGGKLLLPALGGPTATPAMFIVASFIILLGAFSVWAIRE